MILASMRAVWTEPGTAPEMLTVPFLFTIFQSPFKDTILEGIEAEAVGTYL